MQKHHPTTAFFTSAFFFLTFFACATDVPIRRTERKEGASVPGTSEIFFRKGVDGRILFRYADTGKVDALIDRRNNEDVVWRKTK